jgi:hypothetical protein
MSLDNRGFTAPLRQAEGMISSSVAKISGSLIGIGAGIIAGVASFEALKGIAGEIKNVATTGHSLQMLSSATGQSARDLVILQKAFEEVGLSAESVPHMLIMMQSALGGVNEQGESTKHIFDQLGLSIDALKGRPAIEQLTSISAAIGQLSTQEEKMAAVRQMFGRQGGEMLAMLKDPSAIKEAITNYGQMADVMQKNAIAFAKLDLAMLRLKAGIANIFVGLTEKIGPQLTALIGKIQNSFDGLKIGEKLGGAVNAAIESVREGRLGEVLGLSIAAGVEKAAPMIKNALEGAFRTSLANIRASFDQAMDEFGHAGEALKNPFNLFRPSAVRMFKTPEAEAADLQQRENKILSEPIENTPAAHAAMDALNKLLDELNAKIRERTGATEESSPGADNPYSLAGQKATSGAKLSEGDRLARIGGFIGGGASGMLDYARRTAKSSEQQVTVLQQVRQILADSSRSTCDVAGTYA